MDYKQEDVIKLVASILDISAENITKEFDDLENVDNEEFNTTIKGIATDRFSHVRKTSKERALKQAKREERTKAEKELAEGLGIEKMSLSDMIEHIKEAKTGSGEVQNEKTKLTKEDLAKHPLFAELVQEIKKEVSTKDEQIEALKQEYRAKEVSLKVESKLMKTLSSLDANLGEDEDTKKLRLDKFKKLFLMENKFELNENGELQIIDEKGEQKFKNDKFDPLTFEDAVKGSWLWDFKQKEDQTKTTTRTASPRENTFNSNNFSYKDEELQDAEVLYTKITEAQKAGKKEEVTFLQEKLNSLANG